MKKLNLTVKDKLFLREIRDAGYVSVTHRSSGPDYEINGRMVLQDGRFRRLLKMGLLRSNNDGLIDGCPQTYSADIPSGFSID